ncbi:hypothetical protein ACEPAI_8722 [Sanghuangporus weigelae]
MRGFRTPLEQLSEVDGTLAEKFEACNRLLEALITLSESRTSGSNTSAVASRGHGLFQEQRATEETLSQVRRLSEEQEVLISDIRRIRGFEDFLRVKPFDAIRQAASEGPVIVLNHSKHRCDALIVLARENDPCVCISLDKDFYADSISLHEELIRIRRTRRVSSSAYDEVLRRVMKTLWERVVSKVVQKLIESGIEEGSRIRWCPTSVLSAFPFHAAGPYEGRDGSVKYFLDDYISSCTSTLTSLVNARSGHLLGNRATPKAVLRLLQEANPNWVHFVCHGRLDDEPFNSSLKLSGGGLTLLDTARANLPNAEFAFLSACHSAEQGPNFALDEALHLAAGMQFCGFRSVVGMMWQLVDRDGPFLAGNVYRYLMRDLDEGEVRFKMAAAAVRQAALNLREYGVEDPDTGKVMTERWVNLVHLGA